VLGGIMNGQSLNRFAYVNGNPVSYIDPTGHILFLAAGALLGESALVTGAGILLDTLAMAAASVVGNIIGDVVADAIDKTSSGNSKSQQNLKEKNISKTDSGKYNNESGGLQKMGRAKGNMTGNHDVQNKQFKDICSKLGLDKAQARKLHDKITGKGYGYREIFDIAREMFKK
jgi:hypothetical protein